MIVHESAVLNVGRSMVEESVLHRYEKLPFVLGLRSVSQKRIRKVADGRSPTSSMVLLLNDTAKWNRIASTIV
jgi:hypothetical protein